MTPAADSSAPRDQAQPAPVPAQVVDPAAAPDEPEAPSSVQAKPSPAAQAVLDTIVSLKDPPTVSDAAVKALKFVVVDDELWVSDGDRRAPLRETATAVLGTTPRRDAAGAMIVRVDYEHDYGCFEGPQHLDLDARNLLARLENAGALVHHRAKRFEQAAIGFATAASLDPSLHLAWSNLACALALGGDTESAVGALDPLVDRGPLRAYHKVMSDPELASLREHPAIVALRAPTAGNVSVRGMSMAYSAHLSMVALLRYEQSWGSMAFIEEIQLFRSTTGEFVSSIPLVGWDDSDPSYEGKIARGVILPRRKKAVNARFDVVQRALRDMGFSTSAGLEVMPVTETPQGDDIKYTARFAKAGLGMAILGGKARVLTKTEVLGLNADVDYEFVERVGYDPDARVAFVGWLQSVPEGCDSGMAGSGYGLVVLQP